MHQSGPPLTGSAGESSAAGPRRRRPATGLINLPQAGRQPSLLCTAPPGGREGEVGKCATLFSGASGRSASPLKRLWAKLSWVKTPASSTSLLSDVKMLFLSNYDSSPLQWE